MHVAHYVGGKKEKPNGAVEAKSICPGQAVHPGVILHSPEGWLFRVSPKVACGLAVPQITMIIIQKFKITSGSNEEENKNHLTSYQPRQHLNMFRYNKSGIN